MNCRKSEKLMRNFTLVVFTKMKNSRDGGEMSVYLCDSLSIRVFSVNNYYDVPMVVAIIRFYSKKLKILLFFFLFLEDFVSPLHRIHVTPVENHWCRIINILSACYLLPKKMLIIYLLKIMEKLFFALNELL